MKEWGGRIEGSDQTKEEFLELMKQEGLADPPALKNKPELLSYYEEYVDAYVLLQGTICLTEIEAYCRIFKVEDSDFFVSVITDIIRRVNHG